MVVLPSSLPTYFLRLGPYPFTTHYCRLLRFVRVRCSSCHDDHHECLSALLRQSSMETEGRIAHFHFHFRSHNRLPHRADAWHQRQWRSKNLYGSSSTEAFRCRGGHCHRRCLDDAVAHAGNGDGRNDETTVSSRCYSLPREYRSTGFYLAYRRTLFHSHSSWRD